MAVTVRRRDARPLWREGPPRWTGEEPVDGALPRAVVEAAPLLLAVTDPRGRLLLFNPCCEEFTGLEASAALGRPADEVLAGEGAEGAFAWALEELRAGRAASPRELVCSSAEGRTHRVRWQARALNDKRGRLRSVLLIGEDLTDLHAREEGVRAGQHHLERMHQTLRALRELERLTTRSAPRDDLLRLACSLLTNTRGYHSACVLLLDEHREVLGGEQSGVGPDFARLLGNLTYSPLHFSLQEAMKHPHAQAVGDPAIVAALLPETETRTCPGAFFVALRHGHRMFGVLCVTLPREYLEDEEEQSLIEEAAALVALALYAGEAEKALRAAEKQAEEATRQYQALLDQTSAWILICDRERRLRYWSPAAEAASGYGMIHLAGNAQVWQHLFPSRPYREGVWLEVDAVLHRGEKRSFETTVRCKGGGQRVMAWTATPLPGGEGHPVEAMLVGHDVTPRQQLAM